MKKGLFFILIILSSCNVFANKKDIIIINDTTTSKPLKEAILILPGLEDSKKGRKNLVDFFSTVKYDVFVPKYIDKNSLENTYVNCYNFIKTHQLFNYGKLHIYSYITGSWTINSVINKYGKFNIKTIVYIRSPLQEMAPILAVENIPKITKWIKGDIVKDLSETPFPAIDTTGIKIGVLIESVATTFIKHYKKKLLAKKTINWNNYDFSMPYDDKIFIPFNHNDMYYNYTQIGPEVISFIEKNKFTNQYPRKWYNWNPFKKHKTLD